MEYKYTHTYIYTGNVFPHQDKHHKRTCWNLTSPTTMSYGWNLRYSTSCCNEKQNIKLIMEKEQTHTLPTAWAKAYGEPIPETHNTVLLSTRPNGNMECWFFTSKKWDGANLLKNMVEHGSMIRIFVSIILSFPSDNYK